MLSCRVMCRCSCGRPLIVRSRSKIASMRRTASIASGAFASSANLKKLRLPCAQHRAWVSAQGLRAWEYSSPKPA